MAREVQDAACETQAASVPLDAGLDRVTKVESLNRRIGLAMKRGWTAAADRLRLQAAREIDEMRLALERSREVFSQPMKSVQADSSEITRDLIALESEFIRVEIDRPASTVVVTTEAIVLEGVYLGEFAIRLNVDELDRPSPYRVEALDPNPAATCDETTHPHVQGEGLCEGEASAAIRKALRAGRLYDFFVIVQQVLKSYNPNSAFVTLAYWEGDSCCDCGRCVSSEDSCECGKCEVTLCPDCRSCCEGCLTDYCGQCVSCCNRCENPSCTGSLELRDRCQETCCFNCLTENRCDACSEEETEEEAEPAVHAVRLGHAGVLTRRG